MLRKFRETLKNKQRGAIMVFFAILVPLFLGAIGLAVDAGFLYMQKAKLQDVADATALAGAGHLKDENRKEQVENAVVAFAGANGYVKDKDEAVSSKFPELGDKVPDSSVTLEENAAWKIAYAIDTGMVDKDAKNGELRDHVRVVILKRVPTFFIRMLFPEQSEVVVKAVAAAEYVAGEEPVVSGDGQKIMSGPFNWLNYSADCLKMDANYDFSLYISSGYVDFNKTPAKGMAYAKSYTGTVPDGREFIDISKTYYGTSQKEQEEKKKADEAREVFEKKQKAYRDTLRKYMNDSQMYKDGLDDKRYIGGIEWYQTGAEEGWVYKKRLISNIKPTDAEIELYIEPNSLYILSDDCLKNVNYVKKLIVGPSDRSICIINTKNKRYGDIYSSTTVDLEGEENYFDGLIYSADELYIWGKSNHMWKNKTNTDARLFCNNTMYLGGGHIVTGETTYTGPHRNGSGADWSIYFDDGSSSGSSSSDTATKSRVRLVI